MILFGVRKSYLRFLFRGKITFRRINKEFRACVCKKVKAQVGLAHSK